MAKMPAKADLYDYIAEFENGVTKRMLNDAFNIAADDKRHIRALLKDMQNEGRIFRTRSGFWVAQKENEQSDANIQMRIITAEPLTAIAVDKDAGEDDDSFDLAQEVQLLKRKEAIDVIDPQARFRRLRKGDHILALLRQTSSGRSQAQVITRLNPSHASFLAVYRQDSDNGYLEPIKKGQRFDYQVKEDHRNGAEEGDLVKAEPVRGNYGRSHGVRQAKILKVLTLDRDPLALNEIGLIEHDIPQEFNQKVLTEADKLGAVDNKKRIDMRHVPFVTIDGADAKDFDDAVFAEIDTHNPELFHVFVAIADVSWYVRPHSALDKSALERGNSVYLPGMVVPMLPEVLSNGWCSLNPDEDRGALVCEIWVDKQGHMHQYKFHRALICSQARLTYKQVHQYLEGDSEKLPPIEGVRNSVNQLHSLWLLLNNARQKRGALALESDERKVIINDKGEIADIIRAPHYESHEIIEELMILANVAAAKQLAKAGYAKQHLCMYRVHDGPNNEKLNALHPLFQSLEIQTPTFNDPKPSALNKILTQAKAKKVGDLVSTAVLRCQSQAQYSPENIGHYGLALDEYCHFTSPIRRYPDLLVHRALVSACNLGDGGLEELSPSFEELAEHCNMTERRATFCERDTLDRLTAQFLAPHQGASFEARIDGLNRSGIFITLEDSGASGFCPMSKLPLGRYIFDEAQAALIEAKTRKAYRLGDEIMVRLLEVSAAAGSMVFQIDTPPQHYIAHPKGRSNQSQKPQKKETKSRRSRSRKKR